MATAKATRDMRYEDYGDRRDKPIGVFAEGEVGRHRFMDSVHRIGSMLSRPRSRLDEVALGRPDALLYTLAMLMEEARVRHGYSVESVDELLARFRSRSKE